MFPTPTPYDILSDSRQTKDEGRPFPETGSGPDHRGNASASERRRNTLLRHLLVVAAGLMLVYLGLQLRSAFLVSDGIAPADATVTPVSSDGTTGLAALESAQTFVRNYAAGWNVTRFFSGAHPDIWTYGHRTSLEVVERYSTAFRGLIKYGPVLSVHPGELPPRLYEGSGSSVSCDVFLRLETAKGTKLDGILTMQWNQSAKNWGVVAMFIPPVLTD